jgi:hypothetical protein
MKNEGVKRGVETQVPKQKRDSPCGARAALSRNPWALQRDGLLADASQRISTANLLISEAPAQGLAGKRQAAENLVAIRRILHWFPEVTKGFPSEFLSDNQTRPGEWGC